jgi:hypothetical protein
MHFEFWNRQIQLFQTTKLKGRPIVSTIGGPLYNLTKYMANILTKSHNNKYAIKNSYDFVNKIKNTQIPPGYIFISLDVQSLFSNIPTELLIDCIKNKWHEIQKHTAMSQELFIEILNYILRNNYFVYENQSFCKRINSQWVPASPV